MHSVRVAKCVLTRSHHCGITENSFAALKICVLAIYSYATIDLVTVLKVLSFPEYYRIGIIQNVAFQAGFFHLVVYI